jgi:dTDP-4-dehydrorhamnose reductase
MPVRPILVVGKSGQLARCLVDSAAANGVGIEALGRSQLDLEDAGSIQRIVRATRPSAIINAAAYTFVEWLKRNLPRRLQSTAMELSVSLSKPA